MNDTTTPNESEVTRADALLLFNLINDEAVSEDARRHLTEYVDDILSAAPTSDPTNNKAQFLRTFAVGWRGRSFAPERRRVFVPRKERRNSRVHHR